MVPKSIQNAFFASMAAPQAFRLMFDQQPTQATDLHPLAKKIVALLPNYETLTLSQIMKLTKGKPNTVKLRLKELVDKSYLVPKGQGRGAYYERRFTTPS
jgi:Fic family protein